MGMKTKSPLQTKNIRQAGETLQDALLDEALNGVMLPLSFLVIMVIFAGLEWWRHLTGIPPAPKTMTVIAAMVAVWAILRARQAFARAQLIKQGRDGERWVALILENLRPLNFRVYHDIPLGDANIDHVLIGPRGVYTIETKTLSKPSRGECRISVKDDAVLANGDPLKRNPLVQAKAQANWLGNYFRETGFKVQVQPVVVFPGWFVEPFDHASAGVWVLEPKALGSFLDRTAPKIEEAEARALAKVLANYVRGFSGENKVDWD